MANVAGPLSIDNAYAFSPHLPFHLKGVGRIDDEHTLVFPIRSELPGYSLARANKRRNSNGLNGLNFLQLSFPNRLRRVVVLVSTECRNKAAPTLERNNGYDSNDC